MALKIGFTNKYYTLWDVSEPYKVYTGKHSYYEKVDYYYIQNLSFDIEKAIEKAAMLGCKTNEVDEELYGRKSHSFSKSSSIKYDSFTSYQIPPDINIAMAGIDIRTCDSISILWAIYFKKDIVFAKENPVNPHWKRPIVYARKRLVELGELIKYDGKYISCEKIDEYKKNQEIQKIKDNAIKGHIGKNGERKELSVLTFEKFGFQGWDFMGGMTWINVITFIDENNCMFKYVGNKNFIFDEFTKIKATFKHSEYNGVPETKLQRITILKDKKSTKI